MQKVATETKQIKFAFKFVQNPWHKEERDIKLIGEITQIQKK